MVGLSFGNLGISLAIPVRKAFMRLDSVIRDNSTKAPLFGNVSTRVDLPQANVETCWAEREALTTAGSLYFSL